MTWKYTNALIQALVLEVACCLAFALASWYIMTAEITEGLPKLRVIFELVIWGASSFGPAIAAATPTILLWIEERQWQD